jgi:hypothetical protein
MPGRLNRAQQRRTEALETLRERIANRSRSGNAPASDENQEMRSGFYDHQFKAGEITDLLKVSLSLADEIAMLRVILRRCFEQVTAQDDIDLNDWAKVLSALSATTSRLHRLVKAQQELFKTQDSDFMKEFSAALAASQKDMGIK